MKIEIRRINNKISMFLFFFYILVGIIVARLFYLQVYLNSDFYYRCQQNFLRFETTVPPRGNILDCNGKLLATNRPIAHIYWQGTGNKFLTSDQINTIQTIETIVQKPLLKSLHQSLQHIEKTSRQLCLCSEVTLDQLSKITELFPANHNILIKTHFKRYYPYQTVASHILGYINQMNEEAMGKMGLEKLFENVLQGQPGKISKIINSVGTNIYQEEIKKSLAGQNIVSTIDLDLQLLAELSFPEHYNGAFIILDPATGAIKSLVSRPHFDPSLFLEPIEVDQWQYLQTGNPFLNRAFNACYPPASIFKLVTVSAALEENLICADTMIYCRGFIRFKGRSYHCNNRAGHGSISVVDALAQSCNILFFEIAKRISIDTLADYGARFGLGRKTNILFQEKIGLVPTNQWKLAEKKERWWPGETLSAAIGQSYLLVTPIQIACMIASIFEGYLIKPRILVNEPIEKQPISISKNTLEFLRLSMKETVDRGTGLKAGKIKDISVYAKTGTGQTSSLEKRNLGNEFLEHAWFVAQFIYKNNNPLIIVILIEHAGTSRIATQAAKKFFIDYRNYMNLNQSEVNESLNSLMINENEKVS